MCEFESIPEAKRAWLEALATASVLDPDGPVYAKLREQIEAEYPGTFAKPGEHGYAVTDGVVTEVGKVDDPKGGFELGDHVVVLDPVEECIPEEYGSRVAELVEFIDTPRDPYFVLRYDDGEEWNCMPGNMIRVRVGTPPAPEPEPEEPAGCSESQSDGLSDYDRGVRSERARMLATIEAMASIEAMADVVAPGTARSGAEAIRAVVRAFEGVA